ncbi:MAG: DUF1801 domain-containing protein [Pseudomonadota bacterium]
MPLEPAPSGEVAAAFQAMPAKSRELLLRVRSLIAAEAEAEDVGDVSECLKWGQPSYVTARPKTGTTLRLACTAKGEPALFTHCQSGVMEAFRQFTPASIRIDGNRAAVLSLGEPLPKAAVAQLVRLALTYHSAKKSVFVAS